MTEQEMKDLLQAGGIELADLGRVVGLNAYELAVQQGFEGTLEEWLDSLKYVSSEEYKELVAQVEAAAETIKEALKSADVKVQELTDLITSGLKNINAAEAEALETVSKAQIAATTAVTQAQITAEKSIGTELGKALESIAAKLAEATLKVQTAGESWKEQIEGTGAAAADAIRDTEAKVIKAITDAGTEAKAEVESQTETAKIEIGTVKTEAVNAVSSAETGAKESIATVKTEAVQSVNSAKDSALEEIAEDTNIQQIQKNTKDIENKLDKNQGADNAGKVLVVGEDGTAKPGEIPIKVDDTLSQTGQAADAEKVGARLHEIDSTKFQGPVKTISGEILKIENAAEQPPAGLRVYGKAKQNTTTGAQLLNAPDKTSKIYGVTMDVSGGIASFSGTLSSNNATFWFIGSYNGTDVVMTLPAGKYYIQNCSMQTLGNSALKTGAITSETEIQITGVAYTYTDSSPKTIYPMINAGTTALPWEPYTGGQPSPNPDYTQEIEMSGDSGKINLLIADGQEEQTLIISTPNGLLGLPVDSGGNYTDSNGQQWVCDEIDFVRGKYIQRIGKTNFVETSWIRNNSGQYYTNKDFDKYKIDSLVICSHMLGKDTGASENTMFVNNNGNIRLNYKNTTDTIEYIADIMNDAVMYGILAEPIETDLSPEEIAAYRALKLYNPVVNVFTAESLMPGIEVDYVPETEQYIEKSINENTQKAPAIVEKASGEMLNVTDSSDLGLKGLKVFGKGEQAKTTGAQLFQPKKENLTTNDGLTGVINSDGSVTVTGTPTKRYAQAYFENVSSFPEGKYFISGGSHEVSTLTFQVDITRQDDTIEYLRNTAIEFKADDKLRRVMIKYDSPDLQKTNYTIYPMLNVGETQAPYEPYAGNQPSPNPDYPQEIKIPGSDGSLEVRVFGAQLIAKTYASATINGITYTVNDDGSVTANGKATSNSFFLLSMLPKANDVFLSGGKSESISIVYTNMVNKGYKDVGNGIYIPNQFDYEKYPNSRIQIQITEGTTVTNEIIRPMLNAGSTALPWEPCKLQPLTLSTPNGLPGIPVDSGGNYTDEKGQQWICDEADFERGKYIQRVIKKENPVFAKNGDYAVEGSELYFCSIPEISETKEMALPGTGISTYMQYTNTVLNRNETGFYISYGGIWARIKDVGDLDAFNAKLQDAVFYFTYKGIPETETDLLEKQLKAYRALHTNYPTTNVSTDSTPQAGLEMEYVADTKSYIDKKFEELQKALVNTNTQVLNKVIMEDIEHV